MAMSRALCLLIAAALMCGCGKETDESLAKRMGNTIGEAAIDFASGVGQGADKQFLVDVELSEGLIQRGFSKTTAKSSGLDIEILEGATDDALKGATDETAVGETDETPEGAIDETLKGATDDTPEEATDTSLKKGITVYLISETPYKGKLIAKAFDGEDLEIGRSAVDVDFGADDAKYIKFTFELEVDMQLVMRFTIDGREETPNKEDEEGR
jgi:hypothetical protein